MELDHIFFLWCLAGVEWLLSKSFLSCLAAPFLGVWGEQDCWSFFACSCWPFPIVSFFTSKAGIYVAKVNSGDSPLCHSSGLEFPAGLLSVCLSECLLFVLCIMPRELYSAGERGKSVFTPLSQSRSASNQDLILEIVLSMNEFCFLDITLI